MMRITLYKDSDAAFCEMLEENGIEYKRLPIRPGVVMASGGGIEILQALASATPWGALAAVLMAWIYSRRSRKVIITTKDNEVFHVEGMSVNDVERILDKARDVNVIDTKRNDVSAEKSAEKVSETKDG